MAAELVEPRIRVNELVLVLCKERRIEIRRGRPLEVAGSLNAQTTTYVSGLIRLLFLTARRRIREVVDSFQMQVTINSDAGAQSFSDTRRQAVHSRQGFSE